MSWCPQKSQSPSAPPAPVDVPLNSAARWAWQYSPGMPLRPSYHSEGFEFAFPPLPASAHYLVTAINRHLGAAGRVELDIEIVSDNAVFIPKQTDEPPPCHVGLYFARRGAGSGATGDQEFYRWFATGLRVELKPGRFTISVPLDPAQWVSVLGKSGDVTPDMFNAAVADCGVAGMTFGGKYFAGHGVGLTAGRAQAIVRKYVA